MLFSKKIIIVFILSFLAFFNAYGQEKEKVILDTDMVEAFDDGVAMILLANAPNIELLGVTTISGNSWVQMGTANALKQLEIEEKGNIPVAMGLEYPLRPERHRVFKTERQLIGRGADLWVGSFGLEKPETWQSAYEKSYGEKPKLQPIDKHAVNFIIDTVRANPNEVTIASIGPLGNLAMAVRIAPDIVPLIKKVVYMGGSFFQPGNTTPAAEFNWYFDPEAAKIAVHSPFKEQIIFGLDVCEKVVFKKEHYDRFLKTLKDSPQAKILRNTFVGQSFENNPEFSHFVWDVLVAAYIIDPSLVVKEVSRFVDVNDQLGISYGQALAYPEEAPEGSQKARIIMEIDNNRFWDLLNDTTYWKSVK